MSLHTGQSDDYMTHATIRPEHEGNFEQDLYKTIRIFQKFRPEFPVCVMLSPEIARKLADILEKEFGTDETFDEGAYQEKMKSLHVTYCRVCGRGYSDPSAAAVCTRSHDWQNKRGRL